jgi:hypothetical protein
MNKTLSRRELLLVGVGAAIAAAGAAGFPALLYAQAAVTPDQFLALSEKLTGVAKLDADVAKTLLGGFLATGNGAAIAEMVADEKTFTSHTDVANAIVAAWYSGLYNTKDGQAVSDFTGALVWTALDFTKPWAECGGDTGYWAEAPGT